MGKTVPIHCPSFQCWLLAILVVVTIQQISSVTAKESGKMTEPVVWWASDPVQPGEAVLLFGSNFGANPRVELKRLTDGKVMSLPTTSQPKLQTLKLKPKNPKPLQPTDHSLKFVLPADVPMGIFAVQVVNDGGASNVILLNRPDVWWLQGDDGTTASPGGWVRAFGKCLAFKGMKAKVLMKDRRGKAIDMVLSQADDYSVTAVVPKTIAEGDYEVLLHNGFGGVQGWSEPHRITVRRPVRWKDTCFNVMDFGADPTGTKDSTLAIQAALAKAKTNGGGIVFFPRGRYMVTETLTLPRFVVLKGESRELSCLFWRPGRDEFPTTEPLPALIQGTNSFGIEDLSIYAHYHKHVIVGDFGDKPDAGNIFLRRVLVRANLFMGHPKHDEVQRRFVQSTSYGGGATVDTVRLGGRNVQITDCDFYGSGRAFILGFAEGAYIARNTFYNGRWGWYDIYNSDGVIFENNQIIGADLMSTGGGLSCWQQAPMRQQNIYFGHNTFKLMHGWDREAMTSDGGGGAYFGKVQSVDGKALTLAQDPNWHDRHWIGAGVYILDGKGAGQYRQIVRHEGRKVELDRPFDIPPDETSQISITPLQRNYILVGNEFYDCTIAIQFYGISINHIVANNKCARAGGFHNFGHLYAGGHQPSWFIQFLDNEILEGNGVVGPFNEFPPRDSHLATTSSVASPPLARCAVHRRNRLRNNARIEVSGGCEDVIVEGNIVENADIGIVIGGAERGVLLRGNRFNKVKKPIVDQRGM